VSEQDLERFEDTITGYLVDMGLPPEHYGEHMYAFRYGHTVLMVSLFEASGACWVRLATTLLRDFRPTLDLVTRLLRLNTEVLLGSFLIFEDDILSFSTTLPGEGLASATFRTAMEQVASVSNTYGEELRSIAGGHLAEDLFPA